VKEERGKRKEEGGKAILESKDKHCHGTEE